MQQQEVVTEVEEIPGGLPGLFSVANGKKVYFSQGNLQYQASTQTWRFAVNQYDYVGGTDVDYGSYGNVYEGGNKCSNNSISSDYSGWIDLFCWGTSGFEHGANCYLPYSTSTDPSDYWAYGDAKLALYQGTGEADWGANTISNGGTGWRTLTDSEWNYLLHTRSTKCGKCWVSATINGTKGAIVFSDDYEGSTTGLSAIPEGCAFLPAAGYFSTTDENFWYFNNTGNYWTADCSDRYGHTYNNTNSTSFDLNPSLHRSGRHSVRLVKNFQ